MKVAMVSEHASPLAALGGDDAGGQNVHVAALSAALARSGDEVVVYTRRDDPEAPRRVEITPRVAVENVDAGPPCTIAKDQLLPYMDEFAYELALRWRNWAPDIVHAHFWMSGRASLRAARAVGIPLVQTFHALGVVKRRHQGRSDTSPPQRCEEEATVARRADRIIATCSDEVFELVRIGADRRSVSIVPCGVDLDLFRPAPRGHARNKRRPKTLLSIGRLVERKGVADVIRSLQSLPDARLVIAGGPPPEALESDREVSRLRRVAEAHYVADRVEFVGRVAHSAVPSLMHGADLVVCAPWYEPFGIVPLEAMACGVPVVATAVGGMIDTVVDGVTGIHVPPRRPDVLASAVATLLDNAPLRRRLGAAGTERVRARFSWERIGEVTHDVYTRTANAPRATRSGVRR